MRKIILDCGSNLGQGLHSITRTFDINGKDWEVFAFEANPKTFKILQQNIENNNWIANYCDKIKLFNKAVWIENCEKQITLEYCPFEKGWIGGATNIMEDNYCKPSYLSDWQIKAGEKIECIDFADFIKNNFQINDYIVCKMDIEGAEYEVIEHLAKNNALSYINVLFVEWHNHLLYKKYDQNNTINLISANGVELRGWG
jgi:FkbM family methyltransferase